MSGGPPQRADHPPGWVLPPHQMRAMPPHHRTFMGPSGQGSMLSQALRAEKSLPPSMHHQQQHHFNKMGMSPSKSQHHHHHAQPRRPESIFPPNTVEATLPYLVKRKKLTSKDLGPVEAWRIMMCLKSGLVGETTWALDVLNILLYDDNTVGYFQLAHLPGMLEILTEHYRRCFIEVFGICQENEVQLEKVPEPAVEVPSVAWERSAPKAPPFTVKEEPGDAPGDRQEVVKKDAPEVVAEDRGPLKAAADAWNRNPINSSFPPIKNHTTTTTKVEATTLLEQLICGKEEAKNSLDTAPVNRKSPRKAIKAEKVEPGSCEDSNSSSSNSSSSNRSSHSSGGSSSSRTATPVASAAATHKFLGIDKSRPVKLDKSPKLAAFFTGQLLVESEVLRSCSQLWQAGVGDRTEHIVTSFESKSGGPAAPGEPVRDCDAECSGCYEDEQLVPPATRLRRKRKLSTCLESEADLPDDEPLSVATDYQEEISRRCVTLSNIFRSLSFIPNNDQEVAKHPGFLVLVGRVLLLHHRHSPRKEFARLRPPAPTVTVKQEKQEDGEKVFADDLAAAEEQPPEEAEAPADTSAAEDALYAETEDYGGKWWWPCLEVLRENSLVTLANVCGQLDLSLYPESVSWPLLDGLLHWAVCPASVAMDPFPSAPPSSCLSPQRLVLETLAKLSVQDNNVDMILATAPFSRLERLFALLVRCLSYRKEPVLRELAVVLLSSLVQGDSAAARVIACQGSAVSLLIAFVEDAGMALSALQSHNVVMLQMHDLQEPSNDMTRRAALTLYHLAREPANRPLFLQHQSRLLALATSPFLHRTALELVASTLYESNRALPHPKTQPAKS